MYNSSTFKYAIFYIQCNKCNIKASYYNEWKDACNAAKEHDSKLHNKNGKESYTCNSGIEYKTCNLWC